jgi:hypothetical protein
MKKIGSHEPQHIAPARDLDAVFSNNLIDYKNSGAVILQGIYRR